MKKIKSVCVYCGTGSKVDPAYKEIAVDLGKTLAAEDIQLVYGGGRVGLMGLISVSATEAGGKVIGIIPEHIQDKEIPNEDLTELFVVDSMHARKKMMVDKSDAFIILPGGFGTLDETFEILTWKYLGLHDKPIVFLNVKDFYKPLLAMVDHMVDSGFTPHWQRGMYQVANNIEDALTALRVQGEHIEPDLKRM